MLRADRSALSRRAPPRRPGPPAPPGVPAACLRRARAQFAETLKRRAASGPRCRPAGAPPPPPPLPRKVCGGRGGTLSVPLTTRVAADSGIHRFRPHLGRRALCVSRSVSFGSGRFVGAKGEDSMRKTRCGVDGRVWGDSECAQGPASSQPPMTP